MLRVDLMEERFLSSRRVLDLRTRKALKWVWMVRAAASRRDWEEDEEERRRKEDSRATTRRRREGMIGWVGCSSWK